MNWRALRRKLAPLRSHPALRVLSARAGGWAYRHHCAAHPGRIALDLDRPMGMGALLAIALTFYHHADRAGIGLELVSSNPLFARAGEGDFLAQWFERPAPTLPPMPGLARDHLYFRVIAGDPTLAEAHALMAAHFRPRAALLGPVEAALAGRERFDLAVHFRGTDKVSESGEVPHAALFAALDPELEARGGVADMFLATDEPGFAAALRDRWPKVEQTMFECGDVPEGQARHFSARDPRDKALEALGNVWLLARAPLLIRTGSFLSAMAPVLAPGQRTRTVSRAPALQALFPEAEILAQEARASAEA